MPTPDRRTFITSSLGITAGSLASRARSSQLIQGDEREFYELRRYSSAAPAGQAGVIRFLEEFLVPALSRTGRSRVGAFRSLDPENLDTYLLIPYEEPGQLFAGREALYSDGEFSTGASKVASTPPHYTRIESRFLRAFQSIPRIETPVDASVTSRVFELRIYESATEHLARLKVEMFDRGETQLMRDVELGPLFFGEAFIAEDLPNLTYMLVAESEEAHQQHWNAFRTSPVWEKMKNLSRYAGTVSKIKSVLLKPLPCSQL